MSNLDSMHLAEALANALGMPAWATLEEVVEAATAIGWCSADGDLEDRARQALRAVVARERERESKDQSQSLADQLSRALGVSSASLEEAVLAAEALGFCGSAGTIEERAREALAAIAQREAAGATDTPGGVVAARRGWQAIADAAWIAAGEALARRDYRAMRALAARARDARDQADPLLTAIFGAAAPDPAEVRAAVRRLATAPADAVDRARRAVIAEMEAHAKRMSQQRARARAEAAARRAAREAKREEYWRRKDAADRAEAERRAELLRPYVGQLMEGKLVQGCGGRLGEVQVPGLGPVQVWVTDSAGLAWGHARFRITGVKLPDFGVLTRFVAHVER